jgi:RNA polymerase sigma factor (sigma-70 family)
MKEAPSTWLARFHSGRREQIEECYREHARTAFAIAERYLGPADRDTVVHQVFCQLLDDAEFRASFRGGSFGAWLGQVVARRAIDFRRKYGREAGLDESGAEQAPSVPRVEEGLDAKRLIERFRAERLPERSWRIFELRFVRGLSQREVARELDMKRATVGYQEKLIRDALRAFLRGAR